MELDPLPNQEQGTKHSFQIPTELKLKMKTAGRVPSPTQILILETEHEGLFWMLFMEGEELAAKCLVEDEVLEEALHSFEQKLGERDREGNKEEKKE